MKYPRLLALVVGFLALPLLAIGAASLEVKIDTARTGAPIRPFIYGQFIEHLGRCIYGGIWAEMLEDRKFYFPVTAEYAPYRSLQQTDFPVVGASPWEIVGAAGGVTMVKEGAFVGDHAPRVAAGAGLRQRDLGVVTGKSYVGYVWAQPLNGSAEIEVSLVWGEGAAARVSRKLIFTETDFSRQTFEVTAQGSSEKAAIELRVLKGDVLLGPPSIMPADNVRGMRRDTLALLKQLKGTIYRWPGGNFVSGYDWRDGIGERDRRPPRKNPAWTGVEHNDFGTEEFIAFCREIETEPMIAANTGFGDAYSARQWVEYCNGSAETAGGSLRVKNGAESPHHVKYWCVGNEMFGPWQLGFMQLQQYTLKHNMVAEAMWKADPTAILVGVGDIDQINKEHDPDQVKRGISWSQGMLESSADYMNLLSEHFYRGRVPWTTEERPDLKTHVGQLREAIRHKADSHRKLQASLPNLKGRVIPIAMDEWNFWHRDYVFGELGCVYDLADGLGVAAGLHEFYRQSDLIYAAYYAQTVNVIGAIKTTKTAAEMETTGLVLQLYREHFGETSLTVADAVGDYDVAAALTKDGTRLTLAIVNPTAAEVSLNVSLADRALSGSGKRWHIGGANEFVHNTPGQPRVVSIEATDLPPGTPLVAPPLSCALFELPLK